MEKESSLSKRERGRGSEGGRERGREGERERKRVV